jgi:hypothetical protein
MFARARARLYAVTAHVALANILKLILRPVEMVLFPVIGTAIPVVLYLPPALTC